MSAASRWSDVGVFGRIFGPKKNHRGAASGMNSVVIISLSSWFALKCWQMPCLLGNAFCTATP